jgi:hypothetical protein
MAYIIADHFLDAMKSRTYAGPSIGFSRTSWDAVFYDTYEAAERAACLLTLPKDSDITIEYADPMDT